MSAAWVTKEWLEDGKRKRALAGSGMRGVKESDRFAVEWLDLNGKRRRKKIVQSGRLGKTEADAFAQSVTTQLGSGISAPAQHKKSWVEFTDKYRLLVMAHKAPRTRELDNTTISHFERLAKPVKVSAITTETIDAYIASRLLERGKNKRSTTSKRTVNRELRHLKAMLQIANEWKYLPEMPKFRMLSADSKQPLYVTQEHFCAMYDCVDAAQYPAGAPYAAAEWWRALLVAAYMTGWRISELLALRWVDVDLENGLALTRAEDNKVSRDDWLPLHPQVVTHLLAIKGSSMRLHTTARGGRLPEGARVFEWVYSKNLLYTTLAAIQAKAGIHLECRERHEHTPSCHVYGFHDFRRGFATMNARSMTPGALQKLMRHRSAGTTALYINLAPQFEGITEKLKVPDRLLLPSPDRVVSIEA